MFCRKSSEKETNNYNYNYNFYNSQKKITTDEDKQNPQQLFLLSKFCEFSIFEIMPRHFAISTKNGTCHFNIEMLTEVSPVISDFVLKNPNEMHFDLNINDEENVLAKFEQLFQGKTVVFEEDELPSSAQITKKLLIKNCPNYLKPSSLAINEIDSKGNKISSSSRKYEVLLNQKLFFEFLKDSPKIKKFTIKTNRRAYICNIYGACASNVIRKILEKDPTIFEYEFDFDDEFNEFQMICDLFNFNKINIKRDNMDSLKKIVELLQINCIMKQIDNYINQYEKFSQKVDEQQILVDSINDLFDLLFNIKKHGISKVEITIIQSKWSQTEEDVQELAAFIFQVVKTNTRFHQEIAELLVRLNEDSNETNKLSILIPFIVKKIMKFYMPFTIQSYYELNFDGCDISGRFSNKNTNEFYDKDNKFIFSFIRALYKRGIISKDEIFLTLKEYDYRNKNFNAFFLPEILEFQPNVIDHLIENNIENNSSYLSFIEQYLPDKIDKYQKMLDSGEPDDELTKSLIHDDVDKLQSILISGTVDISKVVIPYNIFDDLDENPTIINYAAFYGSIKCFKFLLLRNAQIDENTLYFSAYGNNSEIIRIIDQNSANIVNTNKKFNRNYYKNIYQKDYSYSIDEETIGSAIRMHRNNLFDWIFELKFVSKNKLGNNLNNIAKFSASSGNAYALIEIIDKGFDISSNDIISYSAKNGFCKLTQLIFNIIDQRENKIDIFKAIDFQTIVQFGNNSIFKLFFKETDQKNLEHDIVYAIMMNYKSIVDYYFDNIDKLNFKQSYSFVNGALSASFKMKTDELFKFLLEKFKQLNPNYFNINMYRFLISRACSYANFSSVKTITEIILKENPKFDFSQAFLDAASTGSLNICQYFIDKKVYINYNLFIIEKPNLGLLNDELFELIIKKINPKYKYKLLKCIDQAIEKKNKSLIVFLIKEKAPMENALIKAVKTRDIEIVDLILKYNSKPSFINHIILNELPLIIATQNNDLDIIKHLLSIPGINTELEINGHNAFSTSLNYLYNHDIIDAFLDFYGDNIQSQMNAIYNVLNALSRDMLLHEKNIYKAKMKWKLILKLINIKSIDPNVYIEHSTFFYKACLLNEVDIVENLLKIDQIDVNKYCSNNEYSPLMIAIEQNNFKIVDILLKNPKININFSNSNNISALSIAIENGLADIAKILVNDERIDPIEIRLDYSFFFANLDFSKILAMSHLLDVNHAFDLDNNFNYYQDRLPEQYVMFDNIEKTSLVYSVETNNIEKVEIIINHSSFDIEKSDVIIAIFIAAKDNNIEIFKKLIKLINNVNICDPLYGYNLLVFAAENLSGNIIDEIFKYDFNFNSYQIVEAFVKSYADITKAARNQFFNKNTAIEIMNKIFDYDMNHAHLINFSKLLKNGKSFFTSIESNYGTGDVSDFLLNHGVDPNMPDEEGVFPLQHAIKINSSTFLESLINSNRIVYSQLPKGNSYLHFSISCLNYQATKTFIERKLIDINAVNDNGETPLMEACKKLDIDGINLLFQQDNLDYLHLDKKGNDALKIIELLPPNEVEKAKQSKENYHNKIITLIQEKLDKTESDYFY